MDIAKDKYMTLAEKVIAGFGFREKSSFLYVTCISKFRVKD